MKEQKTNAMRILDQKKIPYQSLPYPHENEAVDGKTVAMLTGSAPETVFKTLVAEGSSRQHYVFVIPVERTLDLKKAATSVGEKSIAMIHVSEITPLTGYVRGGCSPIGMKKQFRTVFDSSAELIRTIQVSGGRIGTQIALSPSDLIALVNGSVADITVKE